MILRHLMILRAAQLICSYHLFDFIGEGSCKLSFSFVRHYRFHVYLSILYQKPVVCFWGSFQNPIYKNQLIQERLGWIALDVVKMILNQILMILRHIMTLRAAQLICKYVFSPFFWLVLYYCHQGVQGQYYLFVSRV